MAKKTIVEWTQFIEQGDRYKREFGDSESWATYRNYYRGIFPGSRNVDGGIDNGRLPYNMMFSMARTTVPKTYLKDPYINVTPRHAYLGQDPGKDVTARVVESIDNWLIQELNIKKQMRSGALDGFLCNRMFWKIGYDTQYGHKPLTSLGEITENSGQLDKKGKPIEHNVNVKPGMPWVLRVDPDMMIVPFGVKTLAECEWIDHVILRPTEDVRRDPRYKGVSDLEGTHLDRILTDNNKKKLIDEMIKHVPLTELHEIRDMRNRKLIVMLTGNEKGRLIREDDDVLQVDGPPIVSAFFNEDPDWFWGPPDARIMEPQQLEINEVNYQTMMHRRIALTKFFYDLNKITPETVEKIMAGTIGAGIPVDGSVSDAFAAIQPYIPQDLQGWLREQERAIRTLLGIGSMQAGAESKGRKTATESQIVQMGFESRMDEKRDAMATALQEIMRKVNQTIFSFWKEDKVIQVVGVDGAKYWVRYNNDMIKGEYNMKVDVESMSPLTKAQKNKELTAIIQALSNNPRANVDYLLRQLLRGFEYLDVMQVLPEAQETMGGKSMDVNEFASQQQSLRSGGDLGNAAGQTANALQGMTV